MVCACLMYDYRETTVSEALEYFATMRTNYCKHGKMQGVETPSQLRYCKYFYQLIHITDILKMKQTQSAETRGNDNGNTRNGGTSTAEVAHSEITPLAPNVRGKEHAHPDHKSISQNTRDFYKMVIAASPQRVTANGLSILEPLSQEPTRTMDGQSSSSSSSEMEEMEFTATDSQLRHSSPSPSSMDLEEIHEIQRIHGRDVSAPDRDSRIIDDVTRKQIAKHLNTEDLNISGLKQNRHGRGSEISASSVYNVCSPFIGVF